MENARNFVISRWVAGMSLDMIYEMAPIMSREAMERIIDEYEDLGEEPDYIYDDYDSSYLEEDNGHPIY